MITELLRTRLYHPGPDCTNPPDQIAPVVISVGPCGPLFVIMPDINSHCYPFCPAQCLTSSRYRTMCPLCPDLSHHNNCLMSIKGIPKNCSIHYISNRKLQICARLVPTPDNRLLIMAIGIAFKLKIECSLAWKRKVFRGTVILACVPRKDIAW